MPANQADPRCHDVRLGQHTQAIGAAQVVKAFSTDKLAGYPAWANVIEDSQLRQHPRRFPAKCCFNFLRPCVDRGKDADARKVH